MRLKYRICQYKSKKMLNIQEFVVDEKDSQKVPSAALRDDHFDLIAEQHYDTEAVTRWADGGCEVIKAKLRTPNLFPIAPYAEKIAESIMALARDDTDRCVELFFDDTDLFVAGLQQ